ncbi:hypothetical protein PSE_1096 [Pseudovibrio sp. FO-BEG1]|nr:hypothetical protein PSE_1096 [Pseudovibrio sp. FO-BEG1]
MRTITGFRETHSDLYTWRGQWIDTQITRTACEVYNRIMITSQMFSHPRLRGFTQVKEEIV